MTATISDPNGASSRRRLRLASMEALGFTDRPGMATTWVDATPVRGRHEAPPQVPAIDPIADWKPAEIGKGLYRHNVRWSLLIGILLIAAGAVVLGYWMYQRPTAAAAEAVDQLTSAAFSLEPHLDELRDLNAALTGQSQPDGSTAQLLASESAARDLFATSAGLPSSESSTRSLAADVAADTLEATRLLSDAYAYREAVIPTLALPDLEDDPSLIELDEAARQFGDWRMKFDSVRSVLPQGTMATMTDELTLISGELDAAQSRYLDALRKDDRGGAISAIDALSDRLRTAETLLFAELEAVQSRVNLRLDSAQPGLGSLLG